MENYFHPPFSVGVASWILGDLKSATTPKQLFNPTMTNQQLHSAHQLLKN
jgi:hypothetical protein